MSYCSTSDLLVGDMPVSTARAEQFIQAAADEMDMKLGSIYQWPASTLSDRAGLILKRINALLGTGRLVMAQAVGAEDQGTHAYGTYLLREGQELLGQIERGDLVLDGVAKITVTASGNAPSIVYEDSVSGVDTFYGFVARGESVAPYRPGA